MGCNICGIFGKNVADNLVDRVIPLLLERVVNRNQRFFYFVVLVASQ